VNLHNGGAPENNQSAFGDGVAIGSESRVEDPRITDALCRRSNELDVILTRAQEAIEANKLDDLIPLREQFNKLSNQIVAGVRQLARHRLEQSS
jgi:hypothetical protein